MNKHLKKKKTFNSDSHILYYQPCEKPVSTDKRGQIIQHIPFYIIYYIHTNTENRNKKQYLLITSIESAICKPVLL